MLNKNKHNFHLVDPSPWPFIAAIVAIMLTSGFVLYFHGYSLKIFFGHLIFSCLLYTKARKSSNSFFYRDLLYALLLWVLLGFWVILPELTPEIISFEIMWLWKDLMVIFFHFYSFLKLEDFISIKSFLIFFFVFYNFFCCFEKFFIWGYYFYLIIVSKFKKRLKKN